MIPPPHHHTHARHLFTLFLTSLSRALSISPTNAAATQRRARGYVVSDETGVQRNALLNPNERQYRIQVGGGARGEVMQFYLQSARAFVGGRFELTHGATGTIKTFFFISELAAK